MKLNCAYLATRPGILKLVTIIIGALTIGVGGWGFDHANYIQIEWERAALCSSNEDCPEAWQAELFIALIIVVWLGSIINLLLFVIFGLTSARATFKLVDFVYHFAVGVLVLVGGALAICYAIAALEFSRCEAEPEGSARDKCHEIYTSKFQQDLFVAAGAIGLLNGVIYLVVGCLLYKFT